MLASNNHDITDTFESNYLAGSITMGHKRLCSIFLVLQPGFVTTELDFHFLCKTNVSYVMCEISIQDCPWSKVMRNPKEAKNFKGKYEPKLMWNFQRSVWGRKD